MRKVTGKAVTTTSSFISFDLDIIFRTLYFTIIKGKRHFCGKINNLESFAFNCKIMIDMFCIVSKLLIVTTIYDMNKNRINFILT